MHSNCGGGPLPPVGIWLNLLGYLITVVPLIYGLTKSEMIDSDCEMAFAILICMCLGLLWVLLIPCGILFGIIFFSIKGIRKLKEIR